MKVPRLDRRLAERCRFPVRPMSGGDAEASGSSGGPRWLDGGNLAATQPDARARTKGSRR